MCFLEMLSPKEETVLLHFKFRQKVRVMFLWHNYLHQGLQEVPLQCTTQEEVSSDNVVISKEWPSFFETWQPVLFDMLT